MHQQDQIGTKYIFTFYYYFIHSFFKFDESAIELDEYLNDNKKFYNSLIVLIVIYYLICITCPYPWTLYDDLLASQGRGVSWKAHFIYGVFAIITMIYEVYLVSNTLKKIKHLVPGLRLASQPDCPSRIADYLKIKMMNIERFEYKNFLYIIHLLLS